MSPAQRLRAKRASDQTVGLVTVTDLPHSVQVIVMLLPGDGSSLACTSSWLLSSRIHAVPGTGPVAPICGAILLTASGVTFPVTRTVSTPLRVSRPSAF